MISASTGYFHGDGGGTMEAWSVYALARDRVVLAAHGEDDGAGDDMTPHFDGAVLVIPPSPEQRLQLDPATLTYR